MTSTDRSPNKGMTEPPAGGMLDSVQVPATSAIKTVNPLLLGPCNGRKWPKLIELRHR